MNNSNLDDDNNYLKTFNCDTESAFIKYTIVIEEFFNSSKKMESSIYYKYILIKGVENIYHVFNLLLLYSKNIDLVYNNTKKTILYYCEFIEQIKDDNNKLLNLNIKDATIFIYKKILFNIKKNLNKLTDIEQQNILILDKIIMFYNSLLFNTIITNKNLNIEINNKNIVKNIFKNNFNELIYNIDIINICNNIILTKIHSVDKTIQLYKLIIKYINKHEIKILNIVDIENINLQPNNKIIKKLFKL
tara:strand:+ start:884 stop:1624 length:741 start_codon:yes stop_codon:yes gene_type:complete